MNRINTHGWHANACVVVVQVQMYKRHTRTKTERNQHKITPKLKSHNFFLFTSEYIMSPNWAKPTQSRRVPCNAHIVFLFGLGKYVSQNLYTEQQCYASLMSPPVNSPYRWYLMYCIPFKKYENDKMAFPFKNIICINEI